jgi:acetyl esterase
VLNDNDRAFYAKLLQTMMKGAELTSGPNGTPANYKEYRAFIAAVEEVSNEGPMPDIAAYHPKVELRPGLTAAIGVPHGTGPFPVVVHCHGNGGIAGTPHSHRRFTYDCARNGFLTIMPDYRLAPEHRFPAGFDDLVYSAEWARDNAARYGGDAAYLAITGNSAGCGTAFAVARALHSRASAPAVCAVAGLDGFYDRSQDMLPGLEWMHETVLGENWRQLISDPRYSPSVGIGPGMLPPALVMTGSADFAAANSLLFALTLVKAGVHFEFHLEEGAGHDYARYPQLDVGRKGLARLFDFLHEAVALARQRGIGPSQKSTT